MFYLNPAISGPNFVIFEGSSFNAQISVRNQVVYSRDHQEQGLIVYWGLHKFQFIQYSLLLFTSHFFGTI